MRTTNKKSTPLKLMGSFLTASFIMFGAASCGSDSAQTETEETAFEEDYTATETVTNRNTDYFSEYDRDADERWDRDEFNTSLTNSGYHEEWDADGDSYFTNNELNTGYFNEFDEDRDGLLNEEEYNELNGDWEREYGNNFQAWDMNEDSTLDSNEFNTGVEQKGIFNDWDADGDTRYSREEVNNGMFDRWDTDRDGYLNNNEYSAIGMNRETVE
jgi:Ca2+-binding EF-hand superfamily protein